MNNEEKYHVISWCEKDTPEWCLKWILDKPWYPAAVIEDRELRKSVPEYEFQKCFAHSMRSKYSVDVFEFIGDSLYIKIPNTPETTIFILQNQEVSKKDIT